MERKSSFTLGSFPTVLDCHTCLFHYHHLLYTNCWVIFVSPAIVVLLTFQRPRHCEFSSRSSPLHDTFWNIMNFDVELHDFSKQKRNRILYPIYTVISCVCFHFLDPVITSTTFHPLANYSPGGSGSESVVGRQSVLGANPCISGQGSWLANQCGA